MVTMATTFLKDAESADLYAKAKTFFVNGDHIKAMEIIEDMILVHSEDSGLWFLHSEQGCMLMKLSKKAETSELEFTYVIGSVGCFSEDARLSRLQAHGFYTMAQQIGSVMYYKKCLEIAKLGLSVSNVFDPNDELDSSVANMNLREKTDKDLKKLINDSEFKIAVAKTGGLKSLLESELQDCETEVMESKKSTERVQNDLKRLRSYWVGLDVKVKRDFMKVDIAKLLSFAEGVHEKTGRDDFKQVLDSAKEDNKWTFWICRTICLKKFSSADDCRKHFEQEHGAVLKLSSEKDVVKRIGKDWARKISGGAWEPVDTVAAVEMIKTQLEDVKAFKYKNGWSKEWPLAADDERSKLLKDIKFLLERLCELKILACSVRDCVMHYPVSHIGVSKQILVDCRLLETPQSICFLYSNELNQILSFLQFIKCERADGTDQVCRAVDSIMGSTRVKEKIDFDPQFSFLLLDRRLLKSNSALFDDEGTINNFDPNVHYAKAPAQGDDIISWLTDYNSVDKTFLRPIREHNLDIWVSVLRAVQFTCKTLETKYAKKTQVFDYDAALTVVKNLCMSEYERRSNLQEDQWNSYASLLCDRCEERVDTKLFVSAVRDVFKGAFELTLDIPDPDFEDCLNLIRECKSLSDDTVWNSIHALKSVVIIKVLQIDSKILLIDNSRISLLNDLTRLSIFDNRTYILQLLKPFLLNEIMNMESKAMSDAADAAEADLLLQEEKKSQLQEEKKSQSQKNSQSQKKKSRNKKKNSTSMSSPLVEHKTSENLEPESTSPSLKPVEEDSMELDDTLASERDHLENSSNTVNQEEDTQNMAGEDTLSEHLEPPLAEAATRYNSPLDMTLMALLSSKIFKEDLMDNREPFEDPQEEQVPDALKNLFNAFVSEVIKIEGVYKCLLSDLLASLEEVNPMSSDAAEALVTILESWHCWKNPERESLVTRLFTLEVYERMTCRKCRKKPNYPEQSSYGIVMPADSVRDLKRALGNIAFVDILKVIRKEYKMLCNIKTGGCGIKNIVHHIIIKCPPIFTVVLEWEKSETEKEISETTKALDWEIDISRLYEGLEPNTKYQLVAMVGCGEKEEHICIVYEENRWINLKRNALAGEDVGNWESVVSFCEERKVRPEILFYVSCLIDGFNK